METIVNIQLQIQNLVKLADTPNNQLADIEITFLQMREGYKEQIRRDIYSIFKELQNITYRDMER